MIHKLKLLAMAKERYRDRVRKQIIEEMKGDLLSEETKELKECEKAWKHARNLRKDAWKPFDDKIVLDDAEQKSMYFNETTLQTLKKIKNKIQRDFSRLSTKERGDKHYQMIDFGVGAQIFMDKIEAYTKVADRRIENAKTNKKKKELEKEENKDLTIADIFGVGEKLPPPEDESDS